MVITTYFASAERSPQSVIFKNNDLLKKQTNIANMLEAIPTPVVLLNRHMQAVYCNQSFFKLLDNYEENEMLGKRLGEIVMCENSQEGPSGCGTHQFCKYCPALSTIMDGLDGKKAQQECRISTLVDGKHDFLELKVSSSPISLDGDNYVCLAVQDVSSIKRQYLMERIFIHDIANTATIIQVTSDLLKNIYANEKTSYFDNLASVSTQLSEEIKSHRDLLLAESDELKVSFATVESSLGLLKVFRDKYLVHEIAKDKDLIISKDSKDIEFRTDVALLKRVYSNMVKNALEAAVAGDKVVIGCTKSEEGKICFFTKNPQVISKEIKEKLFVPYVSTKGANRGLGTYSIKLLTENYLRGTVHVESEEGLGTTFSVSLPIKG